MKRDYGIFQVGLKILLKKGGKVLLLRRVDNGCWDLPGGRIDNVEYTTALEKIIAREVREELGQVRYALGNPLFQYRIRHPQRNIYIFVTVYGAKFIRGNIHLSDEHKSYEWVDPIMMRFRRKDFNDYYAYREFRQYFSSLC